MLFDTDSNSTVLRAWFSILLLIGLVFSSVDGRAEETQWGEDKDRAAKSTEEEIRALPWLAYIRNCERDLRSLRARFTQEIYRKFLDKKEKMTGTVEVRRGMRIRLEYQTPKPKLVVSNGVKLMAYDPAENLVVTTPVRRTLLPRLFQMFLGSGENTTFKARHLGGELKPGAGAAAIELIPESRDPFVQSFVLTVVDAKPCVRRILVVDQAGAIIRVDIEDVEINVSLGDNRFLIRAPRDAEVTRP